MHNFILTILERSTRDKRVQEPNGQSESQTLGLRQAQAQAGPRSVNQGHVHRKYQINLDTGVARA